MRVSWRWRFFNFLSNLGVIFGGHIVGMEGCLVQKHKGF